MFPTLSPTALLKIKELGACQATHAVSYLGQEGILGVH